MKTEKPNKAPVALDLRRRLLRVVRDLGEQAVLEVACIRPETLYRAMAGLNVHAGTRALVERALGQLESRVSA
jgi:hypothetical protein